MRAARDAEIRIARALSSEISMRVEASFRDDMVIERLDRVDMVLRDVFMTIGDLYRELAKLSDDEHDRRERQDLERGHA